MGKLQEFKKSCLVFWATMANAICELLKVSQNVSRNTASLEEFQKIQSALLNLITSLSHPVIAKLQGLLALPNLLCKITTF